MGVDVIFQKQYSAEVCVDVPDDATTEEVEAAAYEALKTARWVADHRLWQELANGVQCADCGTTRTKAWFTITQGQWHCEPWAGDRHFVAIIGNWKPFGEPGDGDLFAKE